MIYGYVRRTINEFGLGELREVSISAPPDALRAVAKHLIDAAAELEAQPGSANWHKHLSLKVCDGLGCDLIVIQEGRGDSDAQGAA